jgi:hypothetical protein
MKDVADMGFHPTSEQLVEILCDRTQNTNPLFFRVLVAYYWSVVAAMMRCTVLPGDLREIPVNMYAINLSPSGSGKGHSTNLMEEQVLNQFIMRFREETFPLAAMKNLPKLALKRASRKGVDDAEELEKTIKEFDGLGEMELNFSSATESAIKQLRHKLLMADSGSLNFQVDEIGSNLTGSVEALGAFLELFDVGKIKNSLRKNTSDNKRVDPIDGRTPTNMLLFGTPARLFNGGKAEEELYSMLDTGFARRCFFGFAVGHTRRTDLTAQEILAQRTSTSVNTFLTDLSTHLCTLADPLNTNRTLAMSEAVTLLFIEYQLKCERLAETLPEHEEMKKAEMSHRYFKAMKLAGAYAFVDGCPEVTEDHAYYAIKLAEISGEAFGNLLTRDRPYVKLAKYIASCGRSVTQADMVEDLPFYKGAIPAKAEMMQLAIAWGYQNNIIIKKTFSDGVEFLRGETLQRTDLNKIKVSYSDDIATGYLSEECDFDKLHMLTQIDNIHWCNHHMRGGHRAEEDAVPGFNVVVIDVDKGINLATAKMLLEGYKAHYYTTKRHTDDDHRFRIVLPMNFELKLDAKDYKEFMKNVYEWLPFDCDANTDQRARKWLSHDGHYEYTDGELLDVLPMIPKTTKNEARKQTLQTQQQMDNLERWVINNTGDGNRNNQLLRYAMILVDAGFDFAGVQARVEALNDKLADKLDFAELMGSIMVTAGKAIAKR